MSSHASTYVTVICYLICLTNNSSHCAKPVNSRLSYVPNNQNYYRLKVIATHISREYKKLWHHMLLKNKNNKL